MIIGQSAGIAAALAAKHNVSVQNLPYIELRKRLLAQGQVLALPIVGKTPPKQNSIDSKSLPGIVVDDADAVLTGKWSRSTNFKPYIGRGYIFSGKSGVKTKGDGTASATFKFMAPKSGTYQVLIAYSSHPTRAKSVPVQVTSDSKDINFTIDQTKPLPTGKRFQFVGNVQLISGVETAVKISNENTVGFVIVDAIQLLEKSD